MDVLHEPFQEQLSTGCAGYLFANSKEGPMNDKRRLYSPVVYCTLTALFLFMFLLSSASQGSAAPFYKGKMIRLVVGFPPGGGFDTFARLLARHMPRYLPGEPRMIVQNMPGAGSLVATNRVYNMPGNGLTIVTFQFSMVVQALVGTPGVKFDPRKYIWLGHPSLGALPEVLWIRSELPIRSLEDLRRRKEPLNIGASSRGTSGSLAGELLRAVGLPVKNIYGYKGSAPTMAALERKEIDARVLPQDTMQGTYRRYIDENIVRPIFALGKEPRLKPIPGIATLEDLTLTEELRKLAEFITSTWTLLRPFAVPPGTPPEQVSLLREAFMKAMKSPQLVKDAKRQGVIIVPTSGEEVEAIVARLYQTPPAILEKYKKFAE